jgi:ADP-heptose:LPS heptosyltransferase
MKKFLANSWLQLLQLQNSSKPSKPFDKTKIKNILFVELSKLGDVVTMLPSIRCLHENIPGAQLQFAIDVRYASIIREFVPAAIIHPLDKTDSFAGILSAVQSLLDKNFDLICSMSPSLRNAFLSFRLKGTYKVGFFESYSVYTPFLHKNHIKSYGIAKAHSQTYYNENIEERGLKICKHLGFENKVKNIFTDHIKLPKDKSSEMPPSIKSPFVVLHPFSGWKYRNWNIERYSELAKQIIKKTDFNLVVIGSEIEKREGEGLAVSINNSEKVFSIFNHNLDEMIAVISGAKLFIGNDSGPLHLASALNVPSIGLFGPATPALTAPRRKGNFYFHKKVDCCPCDQTKCIRPDSPCIGLITVSEVLSKTLEYLNK